MFPDCSARPAEASRRHQSSEALRLLGNAASSQQYQLRLPATKGAWRPDNGRQNQSSLQGLAMLAAGFLVPSFMQRSNRRQKYPTVLLALASKDDSDALSDTVNFQRTKPQARPLPESTLCYPAKELCSRCGFCNTSLVGKVREACAFLGDGMAKIDDLEQQVHGRQRNLQDEDELYFGVTEAEGLRSIRMDPSSRPAKRAWTGVITSIACEMLRAGLVDAVLCVASASPEEPLKPKPILARTPEEVLQSGGVKPTLSPNLLPLEELWQARGQDIRRLLFIGVGCQVQALRAVESDLALEALYVLGTNCVDNPRSMEALQRFLRSASDTPETAIGFEFMQDNRIHIKHSDDRYERIPVFSLKDPQNCTGVIAKSCYACHDYVNSLTDLTVGYMGAPWEGGTMLEHSQYCVIRNQRGLEMVKLLQGSGLELGPSLSSKDQLGGWQGLRLPREDLIPSVLKPELDLALGRRKPKEPPPRWLAEFLADVITAIGPSGANFAKASIDRATLRNIICQQAQRAEMERVSDNVLPAHAKAIRLKYSELVDQLLQDYEGGVVQ
eukprot:TRINITY_DN12428_c0_g1_i1.p1 TRINITY_DN12428_c0_g1~~TRINITY_DN12428_c0_g1_i1.p1  ORF type:complete len:586 (+),score=110.21 TRINITY_DN12428_c0_g1_i1:92-1759(+)